MDATAFTITELSGQRRSLVLVERALPYMPFTLSAMQRVEITWYGGNPEGTAQVYGAQNEPTTINGFWKDKYLGSTSGAPHATVDGRAVRTAFELVELVDSMRREGQQVQVTWDQFVRVGLLSKVEHAWRNIHDVEWKLTFDWLNDGAPLGPTVLDGGPRTSDTATRLRAANARLQAESVAPFAQAQEFAAQLSAALARVETAVADATAVVTNLDNAATVPFDAARRMVAVCTNAIGAAGQLVDLVDSIPARAQAFGGDMAAMPLGAILQCEVYARTVRANARVIRSTSADQRATLLRALEGDLLATHTAVEDEDLRDVARQYYGATGEWRRLLLFNQLSESRLRAGQLVLVPRAAQ